MTDIQPFAAHTVLPPMAKSVVAPYYDSMSAAERFRFAEGHPDNYLNAMRSVDEYPLGAAPSMDTLMANNRRTLARLLTDGSFSPCRASALYIYRQESNDHEQSGLVAAVPLAEYEQGRMLPHEHTRGDREEQLTCYLESVRASSSPVCLAYSGQAKIATHLDEVMDREPLLDFVTDDRVRQMVWQVSDPERVTELQHDFSKVGTTYITDGHHRAAAGAKFVARQIRAGQVLSPDAGWAQLLVLLVPLEDLRLLSHNRYVRHPDRFDQGAFLHALSSVVAVEKIHSETIAQTGPTRSGQFIMLLGGENYRLDFDRTYLSSELATNLDVSLLQNQILAPLLNIRDPRADSRLGFLSGELGLAGLRACCDKDSDVGFVCFPPTVEQLTSVADKRQVMPPKSTNFVPKARSGLFVRMF
jgi:uncharacterized protein (DUF1015 family)